MSVIALGLLWAPEWSDSASDGSRDPASLRRSPPSVVEEATRSRLKAAVAVDVVNGWRELTVVDRRQCSSNAAAERLQLRAKDVLEHPLLFTVFEHGAVVGATGAADVVAAVWRPSP